MRMQSQWLLVSATALGLVAGFPAAAQRGRGLGPAPPAPSGAGAVRGGPQRESHRPEGSRAGNPSGAMLAGDSLGKAIRTFKPDLPKSDVHRAAKDAELAAKSDLKDAK
jgi:hypothetical protein